MSYATRPRPGHVRSMVAAGACCAAAMVLAACSSGSSGSAAAGGTPGSAAAEAARVPGGVLHTVSEFSKEPNLNLVPLKAKPARGKKIIYLADSAAPADVLNGRGVVAASSALGWATTTVNYAGDPASLASALQQAVGDKPDAIILSGQDPAVFASALKAAGQAGIPVFDGGVPASPTGAAAGGLTGVSLGPTFLRTEGKIAADWIIRDSGGNASVAIVTLPDFNTLVAEDNGFSSEMKAQCPKCSVKVINTQITEIGKGLPGLVVSALQADPKINYVYYPYGDMSIGVAPALSTANIKVKSVAAIASANTYAGLKAGTMVMNIVTSNPVQGWLEVDLVARYFATHKPVVDDSIPLQILDKADSSSPTLPLTPANYQQQFKTAWHIG